ncbi:hypothetical protein BU16DRAFT_538032 [Lophium mytilinum]|uniref:F-box domain-containing protein n=1 Tax=Lophium mytilinum TaxID=390894 RepID=A0A6A6QWU4_9PEZI|nr:hypothetical protein BU16DRAFT_538032 [Lophium mytilinum]
MLNSDHESAVSMELPQHDQPASSGCENGATFDDLPPELLLRILESIPRAETGTLHSLSSVSHRLHQLVEPYLYQTVQHDVCVHKPLCYLIRTLIERPELALLVRDIEILAWREYDSDKWSINRMDPKEVRPIRSAMATKASEFRFHKQSKYWEIALSLGVDHAAVALLLFITPNVENANLHHFICSNDFWFVQLLTAAYKDPEPDFKFQGLPRLKELTLQAGSQEGARGLAPFFLFPALSKLEVHKASDRYIQQDDWQPFTSNIDTLILNGCNLCVEITEAIIHSCKALKTFEWYTKPGKTARHLVTDRRFQTVSSALLQHSASLEKLVIPPLPAFKRIPDKYPVLRDLRLFPQLKILRVALDTILGRFGSDSDPELSLANALPPNLEELELMFVWGYCDDAGIAPSSLAEANRKLLYTLSAFLGVSVTVEQWPSRTEIPLPDEDDFGSE